LLSARHLTDDQFWFTFFHECGHLLLHRDTNFFLDENEDDASDIEEEANTFASEFLIPPTYDRDVAQVRLETRAIVRLATEIGIAPGVLVARLQRMERVPQNHFNRLKRRYGWENGKLLSRETA
jgi:HTH-type transcriptional regulator/antitoxin HigA